MPLTCQKLLQKYAQAWRDAIVHPFLAQCASGTIQPQQFNTWLVQDYLFVIEFTRMVARVLAAAPPDDFAVLLSGLGALQDELYWFRTKASERRLNLDVPRQPTCQGYCAFMQGLAERPYAIQATALWAIELAYNQAWQLPGTMPEPYTEFAERWGNSGFTEYVRLLEQQADDALLQAPETVQARTEAVFLKVSELEKKFWQMAFAASE